MDVREEIQGTVMRDGLIVIVRGVPSESLLPLAEALYHAGVHLMEVTYAADRSVPWERTAQDIRRLQEATAGRMYIGAGTVLLTEQVEMTAQAGGRFIISPDTRPEVIARTRALGLVSIPGALTPTEAQTAHLAGADFVKLFPVTDLGPGYLKNLCAPLSHIRFLAVGGVSPEDIPAYRKAGAAGFGVGGSIVNKDRIAAGDWEGITALARAFTSRLQG